MDHRHLRRAAFVIAVVGGIALSVLDTTAQPPTYTYLPLAGASSTRSRDGSPHQAEFNQPGGVAFTASGTLLVADSRNHTIRRVSPTGVVSTFAGSAGNPGNADGIGASARFNTPRGLAVDGAGNVYVADTENNLVREIAPTGAVTTLGGGAAAGLLEPAGVAVDAAGNVYVTNTGRHTIDRIAPGGAVTTVAGAADSSGTADGVGAAARFNRPWGIVIDSTGVLFVTDSGNRTIRRIAPDGTVTTFAGNSGVDPCDDPREPLLWAGRNCGTIDGQGSAAWFYEPTGIAIDATGRLVVASATYSTGGHGFMPRLAYNRLRTVAPDSTVTTLAVGYGGYLVAVPGSDGDPHFAWATQAVAVDAAGTALFGDWLTGSIRSVTAAGAMDWFTGKGSGCTWVYPVDGQGPEARFCGLGGLAVDGYGRVYVAGGGTIRKVTPTGAVSTLAGTRDLYGSADGVGSDARFGEALYGVPPQIAATRSGTVYAVDADNHTVRAISPDGVVTTLAGQAGSPGSADGVGPLARFRSPLDVAVDAAGIVYVADTGNSTIRRIDPDGTVTTLAGQATVAGSSDGAGQAALFHNPWSLAVLGNGTLYVADTHNHTIRMIAPSGAVTTLAGLAGQPGSTDGVGSAARFYWPQMLRVDTAGNIVVYDYGNSVHRRVAPDGTVTTLTPADGPDANAVVDVNGTAYIGEWGMHLLQGVVGAFQAPAITASPADRTVGAGAIAQFTASASGNPPPVFQWQVSSTGGASWTDLVEAPPYSGVLTDTLSVVAYAALDRAKYRARVANSQGADTSGSATLNVVALTASPAALRFGATRVPNTSPSFQVTSAQPVTVGVTGGVAAAWTATADRPWVRLTGASGTGSGRFLVEVLDDASLVGQAQAVATVTISAPSLGLTASVTVVLDLRPTLQPPFGQVDTPAQGAAGVQGAIGVTGWALDEVEVSEVSIYRNCLPFDLPGNCESVFGESVVWIGRAVFVPGARPDVEAAFPDYPRASRAGWGLQVLTNMLPHVPNGQAYGGQGPITFYALARSEDRAFDGVWLGRTQFDHTPTGVTLDNDTIAKPFGAIDTPGQGALVSGVLANFGWALTPDTDTMAADGRAGVTLAGAAFAGGAFAKGAPTPGAPTADASDILIPPNGATMFVFLDGVATAAVSYNHCRGTVGTPPAAGAFCNDDIAMVFGYPTPQAPPPPFVTRASNPTRYRNLDAGRGAIGAYTIDTTTLSNGLHTIAWSVTDSAGRTEGIGSRFFQVLNTGTRDRGPGTSWTTVGRVRRTRQASAGSASRPYRTAGRITEEMGARVFPDPGSQVPDPAVLARVGFDLNAPFVPLTPDADGVYHVRLGDLDRLELRFAGSSFDSLRSFRTGEDPASSTEDPASSGLPVTVGYLEVNGELRELPIGAALDPDTGVFTWAAPPGYLGTYRLAFGRARSASSAEARTGEGGPNAPSSGGLSEPSLPHHSAFIIDVTIAPRTSPTPGESAIRMSLDAPADGAILHGRFTVAGWVLDPQAAIGAGIGAVHVWALRADVAGAPPVFLGAAELGGSRPDVAAAFGAQFGRAGFVLAVPGSPLAGPSFDSLRSLRTGEGPASIGLGPGAYSITVYAWNTRTQRWENARSISVSVR